MGMRDNSSTSVSNTIERQLSNLVIYDPAHSTQELYGLLSQVVDNSSNKNNVKLRPWQKKILKPINKLPNRDYQLLYIKPGFMSEEEYERSKFIHSILA
jgi:hypothetical protein